MVQNFAALFSNILLPILASSTNPFRLLVIPDCRSFRYTSSHTLGGKIWNITDYSFWLISLEKNNLTGVTDQKDNVPELSKEHIIPLIIYKYSDKMFQKTQNRMRERNISSSISY